MILLPITPITTALAAAYGPVKKAVLPELAHLTAHAVFDAGAADGTSVDVYLQTSLNGGLSYMDVMNFHFTTADAEKVFNVFSGTPITSPLTPTDGTLTANTAIDGLFGLLWRTRYKSVGTYTGDASVALYVYGVRMVAQPSSYSMTLTETATAAETTAQS